MTNDKLKQVFVVDMYDEWMIYCNRTHTKNYISDVKWVEKQLDTKCVDNWIEFVGVISGREVYFGIYSTRV